MTQSRFPLYSNLAAPRALAWRQSYAALRNGSQRIPSGVPVTFVMDLPQFPLEVRVRGTDGSAPVVLCTAPSDKISHTSPAAARRGVRPGMSVRNATALCPGLQCLSRDLIAESAMQLRIQQWFLQLGLDVEFVSAAPGTPVGLRITAPAEFQAETRLASLRRDLRRLGFRACSQTRQGSLPARGKCLFPVPAQPGDPLQLALALPWAVERPAALNVAVERLLDDLRFELEVSGRTARWVQVCCASARGERIHHRFEVEDAPDALALVARELRRWMHTDSIPPIAALELRAGLTPGASAAHRFVGYSNLGIQ